MSSSSEPRPPPFTNDVGTVYDRPEKPPIEDESPQHSEVSPISPVNNGTQQLPLNLPRPTYASSLGSRSMSTGSLHGQPPPFNGHQPPHPNHAFTFPNLGNSSTRKVNFDRFAIPTKNATLSSGFPYDPRVYDLITHDEWHLLSSDIVNAAKLSFTEDFAAWTTGVTTGTLSSAFLVIGGPVVGYFAGRAVHRRTVVKTVKERLDRDGDLRSVLRRWNDQKFTHRGFQVWLELPVDGGEIVIPEEKKPKSVRKAEKKTSKRFRIVIIPNNETVNQTPTYAGPWSPVSPVSQDVPLVEAPGERETVEAMGNEHRDPVELENERAETVVADGLNSTPAQAGTPRKEDGRGLERSFNKEEDDGVTERFELA